MSKRMKLAAVAAGAFLALAAVRASALAAEGRKTGDRVQYRVERMKERLNLTDDQARQIESILRDAQQQGQTDREAMRERHQKVHEQILSVLTPEQKQKLEEMKRERGPHRGGRRNRQANPTNEQ